MNIVQYLHGKLVASMAAAVDDVEAGHWHEDVLHLRGSHQEMRKRVFKVFHPSKVGDVSVERNTLVSCTSLWIDNGNSEAFRL